MNNRIFSFALMAALAASVSDAAETAPTYSTQIDPLLTTQWGQRGVYAKLTPKAERTGCWAAALAQILYYHKVQPSGEVTFYPQGGLPSMVVDLSHKFDWNLFVDSITESTPMKNQDEVATYCYYTFLAINEKAWAPADIQPKTPFSDLARAGLKKYFKCQTSRVRSGDPGGMDAVKKTVLSELTAKRPLMLYAGPHAFVIDGVRVGDKGFEVHLNCGWGGTDNKWYVFDQPFDTHFGPLGDTARWVMLIRPPAAEAASTKAKEDAAQAGQDVGAQRTAAPAADAADTKLKEDAAIARQAAAESRDAENRARQDAALARQTADDAEKKAAVAEQRATSAEQRATAAEQRAATATARMNAARERAAAAVEREARQTAPGTTRE